MSHPFERYLAKHRHYPRIRLDNGIQKITVEFAPGYVKIETSPPFSGRVYIRHSTWLKLLTHPALRSLTRKMRGDFDVPQKLEVAFRAEQLLHADKRARKRAERDAAKAEAQRRRYEAAQRRARGRT